MTARGRRWLAPATCLLLTLFSCAKAQGFCRANSCDPSRGESCTVDANGCHLGARTLYWGGGPIPFLVQADGSPKNKIDATTFEKVIQNAFHTWSDVYCAPGKHPSFAGVSTGQTPSSVVEYIAGQANANIFMFRDDTWMATAPGSALALTTVSYDWHTGQIYDADVEVNGTGGNITNGLPMDGADLPSIMTHELGHFLGLDHSPKKTATMFVTYQAKKGNLRVLDSDDIAGVCAIYPPKAAATIQPPHYVVGAPLAGCSAAPRIAPANARSAWLLLALGCAVALGIRRAAHGERRET